VSNAKPYCPSGTVSWRYTLSKRCVNSRRLKIPAEATSATSATKTAAKTHKR